MSKYESDATAEVLRDVDSLADFMCGECMNVPNASEWPHIREASAEDFKHATTANLIGLLFDAGQPANVTQAARDAIANRFLAQPAIRARVARIADRMERDAAADREEVAAQFRRIHGYSAAARPTKEAA